MTTRSAKEPKGILEVTSPFDGSLIKTLSLQSLAESEQMLATAYSLVQDRESWLEHDQRIAIL